jgi:hypothetical protein
MSEESAGRFLVTGVDAAGRSCAARDEPMTLQGGPGLEGMRRVGALLARSAIAEVSNRDECVAA